MIGNADLMQKLQFKDNDVFLMRLSDMVSRHEYIRLADTMSQTIKRINPTVTVIILPYTFGEVGTLSEEEMKSIGWVKAKAK